MSFRNIIILILVIFSPRVVNAQSEVSQFYIAGNLGFELKTTIDAYPGSTYSTLTGIDFSPEAGYFIGDHILLGMGIEINSRIIRTYPTDTYLNMSGTSGYNDFYGILDRWRTDTDTIDDSSDSLNPYLYTSYEDYKTVQSNFGLQLFAKYHWSLTDHIEIAVRVSLTGANNKYYSMRIDSIGNESIFISATYYSLRSSITPELLYLFSDHLGIMLFLPGMSHEYSWSDETIKSSRNKFNFLPEMENFSLGMLYRF